MPPERRYLLVRQLNVPDQPLPGDAQTVQRTVLCMGRKQEAVENVPVGNTVRTADLTATVLPTFLRWPALANAGAIHVSRDSFAATAP